MTRSALFAPLRFLPAVLLLCADGISAAPVFPELSGRVVDRADLLSPADEAEITAMLAGHERRTGNQIVVVTLHSLGGYEFADYGYQLGRHWGIGQAGRDNGALLIVVPDERKVRIEVGYGLEGTLTDARSHQIIQQTILPRFKAGDFSGGIRTGLGAIMATIEGDGAPWTSAPRPARVAASGSHDLIPVLVLGTVFFLRELLAGFLGGRVIASVVTGTIAGLIAWLLTRLLWVGIGIGILFTLLSLFSGGPRGPGAWARRTRRYRAGFPGDEFGGDGFPGGGFGGGGGSFGGGGASGRW